MSEKRDLDWAKAEWWEQAKAEWWEAEALRLRTRVEKIEARFVKLLARLEAAERLAEAARNIKTPCDWEQIYDHPPEYRCQRCGRETIEPGNYATCPAIEQEFLNALAAWEKAKRDG